MMFEGTRRAGRNGKWRDLAASAFIVGGLGIFLFAVTELSGGAASLLRLDNAGDPVRAAPTTQVCFSVPQCSRGASRDAIGRD